MVILKCAHQSVQSQAYVGLCSSSEIINCLQWVSKLKLAINRPYKTDLIPPINKFEVNWGLFLAVSLYSDRGETSLPLEYTDQRCCLLPAALIEQEYTSRAVEQKSMGRSTSVQPQQPHFERVGRSFLNLPNFFNTCMASLRGAHMDCKIECQ